MKRTSEMVTSENCGHETYCLLNIHNIFAIIYLKISKPIQILSTYLIEIETGYNIENTIK